MTKTVIQVLEEARDLIAEKGLAKENYVDSKGRYCSLGALHHVTSRHEVDYYNRNLFLVARRYLEKAIASDLITRFNDKKGINKSHVIAKFNKAIELAKQNNEQ